MNLTKVFQGDPPQINLRNTYICQSLVSQPSPVLPNQSKVFQENSGAFNLAFLSTRCLFHPPISYSGPVLPVDDLLNKATILWSCRTYPTSSKNSSPDLSFQSCHRETCPLSTLLILTLVQSSFQLVRLATKQSLLVMNNEHV